MLPEKCSGVIVFRRNDEKYYFLLIKHSVDKGGHWAFPKGHVEEDESCKDATIREVFEETGLEVKILDGFRENVSYQTDKRRVKDVAYYLVEAYPNQNVVNSEEIVCSEWLKLNCAIQRLTFDDTKTLLRKHILCY